MRLRPATLLSYLLLALGVATGAAAQAQGKKQTMLPVWNSDGKVEAALILEPTGEASAGARWRFGSNTLTAAFGLESNDSLGLVCNRQSGIASIANLSSYCNVAMLDNPSDANVSQHVSVGSTISRGSGRLGLTVGTGHDTLPAWLNNRATNERVEQNDLAIFGQKNIGREGFVTIGGAVARARLVPASELVDIPDQWNSKSLTVGGGYGAFSANIVGRVVDVPGQPGKWEGLGVGLTWRTPWSGQLTVGAENVITRGKNPFAPSNGVEADGTVPYVRYEQDL